MTHAHTHTHTGSYREWFLKKVRPFLQEHPTVPYIYVFHNIESHTYLLTPVSEYKTLFALLRGYAKTQEIPIEDLFTHASVFLNFSAASAFVARLQSDGYMDMQLLASDLDVVLRTMNLDSVKCFNPIEGEEVYQSPTSTRFYIFNKQLKLILVICLDDESFHKYFGKAEPTPMYDDTYLDQLADSIPSNNAYIAELEFMRSQTILCNPQIVYKCTDDAFTTPIRRLPFTQHVYIYEFEAETIQKGGQYALVPSNQQLGEIISDCVVQGGSRVSADHCQTYFSDMIHRVKNITLGASKTKNMPYMGNELRGLYSKNRNAFQPGEMLQEETVGYAATVGGKRPILRKHTLRRKGRSLQSMTRRC